MAMTLMVIVGGAAIPLAHSSIDRSRAAGAASYVAGRMASARFEAVRRSAYVAIRFVAQPDGYWLQTYVDGNRNGVLTARHRAGHRRPDHGRRTSRLSLLGSRVRYSAQTSAASIRARSTRATRFKSAARRCSASARQGRPRQARCSFEDFGATSSPCACSARPDGRASWNSTSEHAHGWCGSAGATRVTAGAGARDGGHGAGAPAAGAHGAHRRSRRQAARSSKRTGDCCLVCVSRCRWASRFRCFASPAASSGVMWRCSIADASGIAARWYSKSRCPSGKRRPTVLRRNYPAFRGVRNADRKEQAMERMKIAHDRQMACRLFSPRACDETARHP